MYFIPVRKHFAVLHYISYQFHIGAADQKLKKTMKYQMHIAIILEGRVIIFETLAYEVLIKLSVTFLPSFALEDSVCTDRSNSNTILKLTLNMILGKILLTQKLLFSLNFVIIYLCPIQWVLEALSPKVKWPGREADCSPPSNAKVKNAWSYTSTPSIRLLSVVVS